jgi:hypothetical protein
LHSSVHLYPTMVYTGKPSRGCGMCKSRRIKVSPVIRFSPALYMALFVSSMNDGSQVLPILMLMHHSATRNGQRVGTARNLGVNVQDIRTSLIWYSEMKTKLWLARRGRRRAQSHLKAATGHQARKLHHICEFLSQCFIFYSVFGPSQICCFMDQPR